MQQSETAAAARGRRKKVRLGIRGRLARELFGFIYLASCFILIFLLQFHAIPFLPSLTAGLEFLLPPL